MSHFSSSGNHKSSKNESTHLSENKWKLVKKIFQISNLHFPKEPINKISLPLKIGSNVSVKQYNKFLECKVPRGYKYQLQDNGDVLIIDMSSNEHSELVSWLTIIFNTYNGGIPLNRPIRVGVHPSPARNGEKIAPDLAIAPSLLYIPRSGVRPSDTNGNPHARIVVEIGNQQSNETWIEKCQTWKREPYVRYVFGLKFYKPKKTRDSHGWRHRAMTAILYTQGENDREWDFGTVPKEARIFSNCPIPSTGCIAPGLGAFTVNIPVIQVFYNPPIPVPARYTPAYPNGVNIPRDANFTIDLYLIQQEVLRVQKN
ncbi:hypothetical protein Glove_329g46 [Diversispora epigaea]|uniref:Uncharacterized protein n=1 Tax=Diversispora epigaea TaxID=1348612 RepID=A0A397HNF9_9GLOM|nr:hypothetical protein Glove_329g46 [Diversispora epigaea]